MVFFLLSAVLNICSEPVTHPELTSIDSSEMNQVNQLTDLLYQLTILKEKLSVAEEQVLHANNSILELNSKLSTANYRIALLEKSLEQRQTVEETIKNKPKAVGFYTGIDSFKKPWMMFQWIVKFVPKEDKRVKLNYFNQFCLTLMKLRLNLREQDLGYRFNVAKSTVSKYFLFLVHPIVRTNPIYNVTRRNK